MRGAVVPATGVALISIVVAYLNSGRSGLYGALLAGVTVIIFFSISLLVARLTSQAEPMATMALAIFSYFTKLLVMSGFLVLVTRLSSPDTVDRRTFGISALAITFGWLLGEIRAFFRLRLQLPLSKREGQE